MSIAKYEAETRGVIVRVQPQFLPEQSDPAAHRWVWAYRIELVNASAETVQLISRHWIITDGNGRVEEVRGPGVVGEQPTLRPGDGYTYASGCPLTTPSGSMVGSYQMVSDAGERFDVAVPPFSLDLPGAGRVLN
jgi:ApaG protein